MYVPTIQPVMSYYLPGKVGHVAAGALIQLGAELAQRLFRH